MNEIGKYHCGQEVYHMGKKYTIVGKSLDADMVFTYWLAKDKYSRVEVKAREENIKTK